MLLNSVPAVSGGDGTFNPFHNYNFTGSMRPVYPLSPRRIIPEHIKRPDYAESGRILGSFMSKHLWELILFHTKGVPTSEVKGAGRLRILTLEEQEKMRVACRVCSKFWYLRLDRQIPRMHPRSRKSMATCTVVGAELKEADC